MRLVDWESRLNKYIFSKQYEPFKWGENDCAFFTAGAIEAMTGMDLAHWVHGEYDSRLGALKQAAKLKCKTLADAEARVLDDVLPRKQLCRNLEFGDIVTAKIEALDPLAVGDAVGVIYINGAMLVPGGEGLMQVINMEISAAWSV